MEIEDSTATRRREIHFPVEIVGHVISFLPSNLVGQKTFWSCCLVSHAWYSAALPKLYEKPLLRRSNFKTFALTICPPDYSHVRHIGHVSFGDHVKHLDLGGIVYEHTSTRINRLLRRMNRNLKVFIAPHMLASASILVPLGTCSQLKVLDFSRTEPLPGSPMIAQDILGCACKLDYLMVLSFPAWASADFDQSYRAPDLPNLPKEPIKWPTRLAELEFSGMMPLSYPFWREVANTWPQTLKKLSLSRCKDFYPFYRLRRNGITFNQITSLQVTLGGENPRIMHIDTWLAVCPELRFLSVPAAAADFRGQLGRFADDVSSGKLEQLELTREGEEAKNFRNSRLLSHITSMLPNLWQIRLDESYFEFDDIWADCQDVDAMLKERATKFADNAEQMAGSPRDVGVVLFKA